jgi:hypothetical protein
MKQLLIAAICLLPGAAHAQTESEYTHAIYWGIRSASATPYKVRFTYPATYERIAPPFYERKHALKVNGVPGYGYAKMKFNGGDPKNLSNWTVVKAYIE